MSYSTQLCSLTPNIQNIVKDSSYAQKKKKVPCLTLSLMKQTFLLMTLYVANIATPLTLQLVISHR